MDICDTEGRDCIEKISVETFNCSTTCVGIYADVQWGGTTIKEDTYDEDSTINTGTGVKPKNRYNDELLDKVLRRLADLEKEMDTLKGAVGHKGEELDMEKYKLMITEYRKYKSKNVKHFRLSSSKNLSIFGESFLRWQHTRFKIFFATQDWFPMFEC